MISRHLIRLAIACLATLGAQAAAAQDAKAILERSIRAMGIADVSAVHYYGSGASFSLGQSNNANQPWPRTNLNEYARAIDFASGTSRATWTSFATPVTGGAPALAMAQQVITATSPGGWSQQLEIWTTPWGFLKGAQANGATASRLTEAGQRLIVLAWNAPVKSPGGVAYRVVGYLDADGLVRRVETAVENPVFGDMPVVTEFRHYRDNKGLKYPAEIVQKRGGWPVLELQLLAAFANPPNLQALLTPAAGPAPGAGGPPPGASPPPAASEQLSSGVFRIRGAYNSLAVEFADHVLLFEPGPQNEARAVAGIAETRRLFPGKPIRYGVITHHHFDHTGGIAAVAAEGITIVTPAVNAAFLRGALSGPRTLAPDALARSGRKPVIEGFDGAVRVFEDATRRVEIHVIEGLPHADGLVVGWLPREKLLVYADMFNLPPPNDPVPDPPVVGTRIFLENLERLGIEPDRILSIHSLVPDRLATMQDIRGSLGRTR
jgi:glyoxylase-like metal-dependent hydrolase (beta-lactamase superfamily II)